MIFFFAGTGNVEKNDEINVVFTTLWWVTDTTMKYTGVGFTLTPIGLSIPPRPPIFDIICNCNIKDIIA